MERLNGGKGHMIKLSGERQWNMSITPMGDEFMQSGGGEHEEQNIGAMWDWFPLPSHPKVNSAFHSLGGIVKWAVGEIDAVRDCHTV